MIIFQSISNFLEKILIAKIKEEKENNSNEFVDNYFREYFRGILQLCTKIKSQRTMDVLRENIFEKIYMLLFNDEMENDLSLLKKSIIEITFDFAKSKHENLNESVRKKAFILFIKNSNIRLIQKR